MVTQERTYNTCLTCHQRTTLVHEEVYGCDTCLQVIDLGDQDQDYLEVTVFYKNDQTDRLQFCSWTCCLKKLHMVTTDYFISLPCLLYNQKKRNGPTSAQAFLQAIRR